MSNKEYQGLFQAHETSICLIDITHCLGKPPVPSRGAWPVEQLGQLQRMPVLAPVPLCLWVRWARPLPPGPAVCCCYLCAGECGPKGSWNAMRRDTSLSEETTWLATSSLFPPHHTPACKNKLGYLFSLMRN